ncbi:MAG: hypothetical protein ACMUJM_17290 [bacterium]
MNYFLIVSLRRCGSTYCASELDSYKDVYCQYEFVYKPPHKLNKNHKRIDLEEENFSFPASIDSFCNNSLIRGSKVTFPDYQPDKAPDILRIIRKDKVKVIHIIRSLHEQMVSQKNVEKSGVYHVLRPGEDAFQECLNSSHRHFERLQDTSKIEYKYHFTPSEVDTFCSHVTSIDAGICTLQATNPYLLIPYPDLTTSIETILAFLQVPKIDSTYQKIKKQGLKKIIKSDHKDMIENWSQVRPLFEKWEREREKLFSPDNTKNC